MDTELGGVAFAPNSAAPFLAQSVKRAARDYGWRLNGQDKDGAITLRVTGEWSDYDLTLRPLSDQNSIEVCCIFALAPPRERWIEVAKLAESLNRSFHRGSLELRINEDHGTYTDWVPMTAARRAIDQDLIEAMRSAVGTCDMLLFPAFHCVAWAEINAETALDRLNFGPTSSHFH